MTFESIILKLAPFTYINEEQEVQWGFWSDLSDGDKIITSVEILLILLFTYYIVKLFVSWKKDKKQINLLLSTLDKYKIKIKDNHSDGHLDISNEYQEMLEEINNSDQKLAKLWKEFDESLIKKSDGEKFFFRNSIDAEYFFNKKTMVAHLGSKLFSSIPGLLLGIGLLGTFIGLYFALIQMDVTNVDKLQESIKILINIAGVKFAASIWGLGLSVLFTLADKQLESSLEEKLNRIQTIIDQIFIRQTAEQNLDSILMQNIQQTKALNGLATSLTEKIVAEFNTTLIPEIALMNTHFKKMPHYISQSINDTFQKPLEKLSETVENLTTNQVEKSNEVLENIIKEFLKELKSAAGGEGEKLKAAITQSQDILLTTSEQLQNTFTSMQNMFQEQQSISVGRDTKILHDLNQIKQDQQEMIQNLSTNVTNNISTMNQEVSNSITKLVEFMHAAENKQQVTSQQREENITNSVNEILSNMETSMSKQLEDDNKRNKVVTRMFQQINIENKELISEIFSTVSEQMNSLNSNSQELFTKLIAQFDDHIDKVKSNVDAILGNLKTEVQNIDVIMSSTSKHLIGLPSHLEKITQSADKLLDFSGELTKSTDKLLQFNSDFINTQENLDKYSKNILSASSELKLADIAIKETLQTSQGLLLNMKNQFGELANKNNDSIDLFGTKVDKFMNDYHDHVKRAIQDGIIHQLDTSLANYASTMADAITNLSEAIDELGDREIK